MVGNATAHAFAIDKYIDLKESNVTYKQASELRYHFICLPTPTIKGVCFTDDIREYIKQMVSFGRQNVFIIRSTVKPGTCKAIMEDCKISWVVHAPEFLSEGTWKEDSEWPDIVVIGGEDRNFTQDVEMLFKGRYKGSEFFITDTVTSETIKYAVNNLYSMKVAYANELYEYAKMVGANYETIKNALYARKWVGRNHLDVHYEGKRGIRGHCLPKDLEAMAGHSQSKLLKLILTLNEGYLRKE